MNIKTTIASGLLFSFIFASTAGCSTSAVNKLQLAAVSTAVSTTQPNGEVKKTSSTVDTTKTDQTPSIRFETYTVRSAKSLAELESKFGAEGLENILKINRVDRRHIASGATLIVPAAKTDLLKLAPFPAEIEMVNSIGKMILVSRRVQAFAAYESGKLVYWGPTSTGKQATPTPAGLYSTNWKAKETRSSINSSWRLPWYFNLDNIHGVAFHQYDLPGVPASHGCVRLLNEDAQWIFGWAEQWIMNTDRSAIAAYGTPVLIFGDYNYGAQAPWKKLIENAQSASVSLTEVETALKKHMPTVEARVEARRTLITSSVQVSTGSNQ